MKNIYIFQLSQWEWLIYLIFNFFQQQGKFLLPSDRPSQCIFWWQQSQLSGTRPSSNFWGLWFTIEFVMKMTDEYDQYIVKREEKSYKGTYFFKG